MNRAARMQTLAVFAAGLVIASAIRLASGDLWALLPLAFASASFVIAARFARELDASEIGRQT